MNRCHVSFTNQQRKERTPKVLKDLIRSAVNAVLEYEGVLVESEMSVLLVDDRGIRELNRDFRNIDRATDLPLGRLSLGRWGGLLIRGRYGSFTGACP